MGMRVLRTALIFGIKLIATTITLNFAFLPTITTVKFNDSVYMFGPFELGTLGLLQRFRTVLHSFSLVNRIVRIR
jgi:hypothetical protein